MPYSTRHLLVTAGVLHNSRLFALDELQYCRDRVMFLHLPDPPRIIFHALANWHRPMVYTILVEFLPVKRGRTVLA